jgi:hypothetical protein
MGSPQIVMVCFFPGLRLCSSSTSMLSEQIWSSVQRAVPIRSCALSGADGSASASYTWRNREDEFIKTCLQVA